MWVVDNHQLNTLSINIFKVRQPTALCGKVIWCSNASCKGYGRGIGRVARVWDKHTVARIEVGHRNMHNTLLTTDERHNLALRIYLYAKHSIVPLGKGCAQLLCTTIRLVAMSIRLCTLCCKALHNRRMWWHIGATDAKRDDLFTLFSHIIYLAQLSREVVLPYPIKARREGRLERFCHSSKSVFLLYTP